MRFEPDILLPVQMGRRTKYHMGEKRLLAAVLEDALHIYMTHLFATSTKKRNRFCEVERWFNSNSGWLYSFEGICAHLGHDASYIRRCLQKWGQKQLRKKHLEEA